jgi:hypothetical protein
VTVPNSAVAGIAVTVMAAAAFGTAVRAGVRHSRLSGPTVVPPARLPRELTRVG